MFLTTVRVRRARAAKCHLFGVEYAPHLVEVMVDGDTRAIARVGGTERRPVVVLVWHDETITAAAALEAVKASVRLMQAYAPEPSPVVQAAAA